MQVSMTLSGMIHRPMPRHGRQAQSGVGLIEVLIAILILSFGMLGIAAMQATTLRNSQSSMQRSQAVVQTYAILDAMRANAAEARIGRYDLKNLTCTPPDRDNLHDRDLADWIEALQTNVDPDACGMIACSTTDCRITVQWDDSRASNAGDSGKERQVVTETRL